MAILEAYFDESERRNGIFCVAGYVFAPQQAKKFAKEWRRVHGPLLPSHMTDLATGGGIYRNVPSSDRNRLVERSVEIINQRISLGVVISCNAREVKECAPQWVRSFRSAYSVCCHLAMQRLGMWLEENNRADRVAYVFERGNETAGEADELIRNASKIEYDPYHYQSHAFLSKGDSAALQAADLLAWEWTKFFDETFTKQKRASRLSFRALMHDHPKRYVGIHLTGDLLRKFMGNVTALAISQVEAEQPEARAR